MAVDGVDGGEARGDSEIFEAIPGDGQVLVPALFGDEGATRGQEFFVGDGEGLGSGLQLRVERKS